MVSVGHNIFSIFLRYEFVLALVRDFPHLKFTLNGGIVSLSQVRLHLNF